MCTTRIATRTERIRQHALDLGFDMVGITDVRPSEHAAFYERWLADRRHGSMQYLAREDAVARRVDPASAWPELRSAVVVALNYFSDDTGIDVASNDEVAADDGQVRANGGTKDGNASRGIIARYARGRDYHKVIKRKLLDLLKRIEADIGRELPAARAYTDTGPVFERELARRAGLGWFGRNTMLVNPQRGSFFFLGTLLLEIELEPDTPFTADRCGSCSSCVDACPTGALLGRDANGAPVMDATRCISYLTIENRGAIPRDLRPLIGNRIFGCDICQEVCPFPRKFSRPTKEPDFSPRPAMVSPSLTSLMRMSPADWDEFSRGSAVRRARRAGFLRNVAVALGNWGSEAAVPPLVAALSDEEPLVRGHAAWALGRIASPDAVAALEAALEMERDPFVREELALALPPAPRTK